MFGLPVWVLVLVGIVVLWLGIKVYKWNSQRKLQAKSDAWNNLVHFTTPRDNPKSGG